MPSKDCNLLTVNVRMKDKLGYTRIAKKKCIIDLHRYHTGKFVLNLTQVFHVS